LVGGVSKMKGFKRKGVCIFLPFLILVFLCVQEGTAQENAYLTGFIRSVDKNSGIMRIDVKSKTCRGMRDFRVPDYVRDDLDASLIGQRIQFFIRTGTCEPGKVYDILFER
jgi:hypothetical protein